MRTSFLHVNGPEGRHSAPIEPTAAIEAGLAAPLSRPSAAAGGGESPPLQGPRPANTSLLGSMAKVGRDDVSRGARVWCTNSRATSLYAVGAETQTMMQ